MKIRFWGVRGSLPTPGADTVKYGGNTSCIEIRAGEDVLILDGGSGLRLLGEALLREQQELGEPLSCHMLFGHAHWDHIQGFPFFGPAYVAGNIIHLYTAQGASRRLDEVLHGQQEFTYFPVKFTDMSATIVNHDIGAEELTIGDLTVRTTALNHPGGCLGYRLDSPKRSVVYQSDHEPYETLLDSPAHRLSLRKQGLTLRQARAQARKNDRRILDFSRGADILVADAAYTDEQYPQRIGYGHSSVSQVVERGIAAEVKKLVLFHHDMSRTDADLDAVGRYARKLVREAGSKMKCVVAREGLEL